jgi:hypothetical protein
MASYKKALEPSDRHTAKFVRLWILSQVPRMPPKVTEALVTR